MKAIDYHVIRCEFHVFSAQVDIALRALICVGSVSIAFQGCGNTKSHELGYSTPVLNFIPFITAHAGSSCRRMLPLIAILPAAHWSRAFRSD